MAVGTRERNTSRAVSTAGRTALDRLTRLTARALDSAAAVLFLTGGDNGHVVARTTTDAGQEHPVDARTVLGLLCRRITGSGTPVAIDDVAGDLLLGLRTTQDAGVAACAGAPVIDASGTAIGALVVADDQPRTWTPDDLLTLTDAAAAVGNHLDLDERVHAAHLAGDAVAQGSEHSRFLAEASRLLAESLDPLDVLDSLAKLAVPALADWCVIDAREQGGQVNRVAVAHRGKAREPLARELLEDCAPRLDLDEGVAKALRTGEIEVLPTVDEAWLVAATGGGRSAEVVRAMGISSIAFVPLVARGRTVGVMTFVTSEADRSFTAAAAERLADLAVVAASAVANANLYAERDEVARILQSSLLPPALPEIPGIELASRYHPCGAANDVGGDFYDVFQTPSGAWVIAIGDVRGKGPSAALVTGVIRQTLRTAAMHHRLPSTMLVAVNDALLTQSDAADADDERFATMVCLVLEPGDGTATLTVSCAGHPPPVVVHRDGALGTVATPGSLLGVLPDVRLSDACAALVTGDIVVLVTDGVLEARGRDGFFGSDRLEALLRTGAGGDAESLAATVTDRVLDWQEGETRDDVAVLAARVLPRAVPG